MQRSNYKVSIEFVAITYFVEACKVVDGALASIFMFYGSYLIGYPLVTMHVINYVHPLVHSLLRQGPSKQIGSFHPKKIFET